MRSEFFDRLVIAFELFLGEQGVDLRVARAADAHGALDRASIKLALVSFIVMARARNEMVPRQRLFTPADDAFSFHAKKETRPGPSAVARRRGAVNCKWCV